MNIYRIHALCQILCSGHTSTPISNFSFSRREMIQAILEVCLNTKAVYSRELLCQGRSEKLGKEVMLE